MNRFRFFFVLSLFIFILPLAAQADDFLAEKIVPDWEKQEAALGRTLDSAEALADLEARAEKLAAKLEPVCDVKPLREQIAAARKFNAEGSREAYIALRSSLRDLIFENPLLKGIPIVFLQEDRYIWQLIHEYNSFYYRFTNARGGDLYQLDAPGKSFEKHSVTRGAMPRGVFATPTLSYDGKTLYFAFADFTKVVPADAPKLRFVDICGPEFSVTPEKLREYQNEPAGKFHLFSLELATGKVTQLTDGPFDDIDPCVLPNGDLVFISTRRGGFARCTDAWEPVQTATLHKLHRDSGQIECLSFHETNEWNPTVLQDGRILYTRWDYVDREAARYMNLWITNPDGTGATALFGNHTEKIVAMLQAKEIPGSKKILFLGSGHHLAVGGTLGILDPSRTRFDPETSEDTLDCIERLTPEIGFPETPTGRRGKYHVSERYYYSPYPLSEDFYLTSYSHEPNSGYLAQGRGYGIHGEAYTGSVQAGDAGKLGLYYRDRFGNLELIYEDAEVSARYPIQLKTRPVPTVVPSHRAPQAGAEGTLVLTNVYESLVPLPKDRPIAEIRVFELLPKFPDPRRDRPKIGHAFAENPRKFLGSVPVEKDGSAYFKVPAQKPLYFQAVDADGRAVQTMLSEVYLLPGEQRGCVGCHEQIHAALKNVPAQPLALARPASDLKPGPEGTAPFSYPLLIQPILDRACVSCHSGEENAPGPDLTGEKSGHFTVSYENLKPFLRFYHWGGDTIRCISSRPGLTGSTVSPLAEILEDENHGEKLKLSDADRRTIYLWLDGNAPFYGTGDAEEQKRQRNGERIEN